MGAYSDHTRGGRGVKEEFLLPLVLLFLACLLSQLGPSFCFPAELLCVTLPNQIMSQYGFVGCHLSVASTLTFD